MPKHFYTSNDYGDFSQWDAVTTAPVVRPILIVTIYLDGGTVSRHTYDWINGLGLEGGSIDNLGEIVELSFPRENLLRDRSSFTITWDMNSSVALELQAAKHNYPSGGQIPLAKILLTLLNENEEPVIEDLPVAYGALDQAKASKDAERRVIVTEFWNGPDYMWNTPKPGRYTPDFQKRLFSVNEEPFDSSFASDKGFDFVAKLQDWSFFWGKGKGGGSKAASKAKGRNKERRG